MTRLASIAIAALAVASAAQAQSTQAPAQAQDTLVLEPIQSPVIVAPDYRFTSLDGDTGQLVGAYAGKLVNNMLLVGGAGYWLVNGNGEELRYGGLLLGWSVPAGPRIRFGARGLVGIGTATLGTSVAVPANVVRTRDGSRVLAGQTVRYLASDDFLVFEPQVSGTFRLIPHVGFEVGGGYRIAGETDVLEDRVNGATGSVAVQFAW